MPKEKAKTIDTPQLLLLTYVNAQHMLSVLSCFFNAAVVTIIVNNNKNLVTKPSVTNNISSLKNIFYC